MNSDAAGHTPYSAWTGIAAQRHYLASVRILPRELFFVLSASREAGNPSMLPYQMNLTSRFDFIPRQAHASGGT
jgi:hypothetical protein